MAFSLRHLQGQTGYTYYRNNTTTDFLDGQDGSFDYGNFGSTSNNSDNGRDAYEFVAFLLWYLFLVLCCVIPTCCAYRRRRLVEARIQQQQDSVNRIERQNFFILSSLRQSQQNAERLRELRGDRLTELLKDTTMVSSFLWWLLCTGGCQETAHKRVSHGF